MSSMGENCKNVVLSVIHGEENATVLKYFNYSVLLLKVL